MSSDLLNLMIPPEDRLVESIGGPGLYYLVPVPPAGHPRWELIAFGYDEYGDDSGHTELWQEYLPAALAMRWARRERARQLEAALLGLNRAFPRGRITRRLEHLHGDDAASVGWSLDQVERRFGLDGRCRRVVDPHETCDAAQRDTAVRLLGLGVTRSAGGGGG